MPAPPDPRRLAPAQHGDNLDPTAGGSPATGQIYKSNYPLTKRTTGQLHTKMARNIHNQPLDHTHDHSLTAHVVSHSTTHTRSPTRPQRQPATRPELAHRNTQSRTPAAPVQTHLQSHHLTHNSPSTPADSHPPPCTAELTHDGLPAAPTQPTGSRSCHTHPTQARASPTTGAAPLARPTGNSSFAQNSPVEAEYGLGFLLEPLPRERLWLSAPLPTWARFLWPVVVFTAWWQPTPTPSLSLPLKEV